MSTAHLVDNLGRVPALGWVLRRIARLYRDGSVVTIRRGRAAGMRFKRFHRHRNTYWLGTHEIPLQDALVRELGEGQVFYDVGANAGFISIIAARSVRTSGHCYAFDPLPGNLVALRAQIELNSLQNCTVVDAAVADHNGMAEFIQWGSPQTAHIADQRKHLGGKALSVRAVTLDTFAASHRKPDCIKIDIEGSELLALHGAKKLLASAEAPILIIELHSAQIGRTVGEFLKSYGYRFYDLQRNAVPDGDTLPHHLLATPPTRERSCE